MRRYFDLDTEQLLLQRTASPVTSETAKLGATIRLEVQPVRAGINTDLATGTTALLRISIPGAFASSQAVIVAQGEKVGTAWVFVIVCDSNAARAQLGTATSFPFALDLEFTDGTDTLKNSNAIAFVVNNAGGVAYTVAQTIRAPHVTRLTGGNPATDLDAQPTAYLAPGSVISITLDKGGESYSQGGWEKIAGTSDTNVAAGVVKPLDYDPFTNRYILVLTSDA